MTTLDNRPSPAPRVNGHVSPQQGVVARVVEGKVEAVEAAPVGSVVDCLALNDYFGREFDSVEQPALETLRSYTWYSKENFDKAHHWCRGLFAALKTPAKPYQFFVGAIVDVYHYDRACRGAATDSAFCRTIVRRTDIPSTLPGNNSYNLVTKAFTWTPDVPHFAVDTVADFLQRVTPDQLWIADYVYSGRHNDPIIYATFGPWEVEVARWG